MVFIYLLYLYNKMHHMLLKHFFNIKIYNKINKTLEILHKIYNQYLKRMLKMKIPNILLKCNFM